MDICPNSDFFYGIFAHFAILVGVGQIEAVLIAEGHWTGFLRLFSLQTCYPAACLL
jgi:hypothetical protein